MHAFSSRIVGKPHYVVVICFLLTGVFAYHAQHLQLDSSVESLLAKNDPERAYYQEIRHLFGGDEIGVIGLMSDNVYTQSSLQKVERLTQTIKTIPEVRDVYSLTTVPDIIADVMGDQPLLPEIPTTADAWASLKQKIADHPVYLKNLVSADGKATAIIIFFLESLTDDEFLRRGIDGQIQALVAKEEGPERLYYSGLPHFRAYSVRVMWEDLTRFVPLTLGCIVVVLFVSFRSLRGVLLPALTVAMSLIWTLAIMVLAGSRLSLGSLALPPLILVLGTAYCLHVVAEYYELAKPERTVAEIVQAVLHKTALPLFISALTTILGFLSLTVNRIVSIQEMGLYSSVGIFIAFGLSTTFVPAVLCLLSLPTSQRQTFSPWLNTILLRLGQLNMRHHGSIIGAAVLLLGWSVWQIPAIQVDSNFQSFFRPGDPISQANNALNQHLAGSMTFSVVIDSDQKDEMKKWDTLRRVKDLQLYIDSLPGIEKTVSFVDYCELLDRGIQNMPSQDEPAVSPESQPHTSFWENPEQLKAVWQLLFLGADSITSVIDHPNYSRTNIIVRTSLSRSSEIAATVEKIQAFARRKFPLELRVRTTGNLILLSKTTGDIITGQIQSLSLATGVIFLTMSLLFLSARIGCIAMIPNVFPILVFFGFMGKIGTDLNIGTSIIATIALGIAVDNTVHLMTRLSAEVRATPHQEEALLRTLSTVGKPAVFSGLLLFLGFLVLSLSTFVPIQEFGYLSALTMVVALVGDVVVLPALLTTTQLITLWDLLYLKLGQDPHKTIPLFAGLRPSQAKIVTLMSELRIFAGGQRIGSQDEVNPEMYIMLKGTVEARVHGPEHSQVVGLLRRGDVFGEIGFILSQRQPLDFIAAEDVEVIAINERFLRRIKWRYPRTAAQIFFNLTTIVTDRLEWLLRVTNELDQHRTTSRPVWQASSE